MKAVDIPQKYPVPWANSATGTYVRTIPETTTDPVAASLQLGWPPETATPETAGGTPPDVRDENGILKQETAWSQYLSAGGPLVWDSAFSTAIGGYPQGAVVQSATQFGLLWFSLNDDNTDNPDTGSSAKWVDFTLGGLSANDSGTANAGVITLPVQFATISGLVDYPILIQKSASPNTGAYTLSVNGFAATGVVNPDGSQLSASELAGLSWFMVVYTGTLFQLIAGGLSAAGITFSQLQIQPGNYALDGGSANALTITLGTIPASLASITGAAIRIKKSPAANTGSCSLSVNGFAAGPLNHVDGSPMAPGELPGGCTFSVIPQGTGFVLQTGTVTPQVAQAQAGNFASDTGAANAYVANFSPAALSRRIGAPFRVLIGNTNTGASTLNYGAGALTIQKTTSSGLKALTGGELVAGQIYEFIDNGTIVQMSPLSLLNQSTISAGHSFAANGNIAVAHGLAYANIREVLAMFVCTANNNGYSAGATPDVLMLASANQNAIGGETTLGWDGTNMYCNFTSNLPVFNQKGSGGSVFTVNSSQWSLTLVARGS